MSPDLKPDRTVPRAIIALTVATLVTAALLAVAIAKLYDQSATQSAQELSLLEGCQRLNILRAEDNRSHYADFIVDSFVAARFLKPTKTETAAQKKITATFSGKLKTAVQDKTWTPITNCAQAVNEHGAKYQAPEPIPFAIRLAPPSALGDA